MSLPLLIVGGRYQQRREQVRLKPDPDLLVIEPDRSIGIKAVRELEQFLQRKPYAKPLKTVVIPRAELLTLPAQQALLKTLEEPPDHSQIILLAENESQLLPTVISRCLVRRLPDPDPVSGRLERPDAAAATSPAAAKTFVRRQLQYCHHRLRADPETVNIRLIRALILALSALDANVNPKLTLDVLSLSYPPSSPSGSVPEG